MKKDLLADVADICQSGRPVIPLLGAGISVDSGIPTTDMIVDYLAKVECYFENQAFHPTWDKEPGAPTHDKATHLALFGYPDPYQLNAELWQAIDIREPEDLGIPRDKPSREALQHLVQKQFDTHLNNTDQDSFALLAGFRAILRHADHVQTKETFRTMLDEMLRQESGDDASRSRIVGTCLKAHSLRLGANWGSFLKKVTKSDADHIDSLFQVLVRGRHPGASHRQLAFLTRRFGWRLVLTTNFDDLVERALLSEGLEPTVFDVWKSAELPAPGLVRKGLSVIKLHGSAYGLRVGESLDVPLKPAEINTLSAYMGERPILLIAGWSGKDQRIRDLVNAAVEPNGQVVWVYFTPAGKPPYDKLNQWINDKKAILLPTHDFGAFFAELYARVTGAHPVSKGGYPAYSQRPLGLTASPSSQQPDKPVNLFTETPGQAVASCAPIRMSAFASDKSKTHRTLWVDVGTFQSVEELVFDIIRKCRSFDSTLPSVVLALQEPHTEIDKGVRRIHEALRRGPYLLALDEIGAFGRPPTVHHGIPQARVKDATHRIEELIQFIRKLVATSTQCKDAYICLSITPPAHRFDDRQQGPAPFHQEIQDLLADLARDTSVVHHACSQDNQDMPRIPDEVISRWDWADLFPLLCTFRRPRSLIALRTLAPAYLRDTRLSKATTGSWNELHILLQTLHAHNELFHTEGGYYWMANDRRDKGYADASKDATSLRLLCFLGATDDAFRVFDHEVPAHRDRHVELDGAERKSALWSLSRLVVQHGDIANYYYSDLFQASKDPSAFFEYLYHQIAAIRYLTILEAFFLTYGKDAACKLCEQALADPARNDHNPIRRFVQACAKSETDSLHKARVNGLDFLMHTLAFEEGFLLSHVPPDTLIRWTRWVREKDAPCLTTSFYKADGPVEDSDCVRRLTDLTNRLRREEAKICREKTDYWGCIQVRSDHIKELLRQDNAYEGLDEHSPSTDVDWLIGAVGRFLQRNTKSERRVNDILMALIDVCICHTRLGNPEGLKIITYLLEVTGEQKRAGRGRLIEQAIVAHGSAEAVPAVLPPNVLDASTLQMMRYALMRTWLISADQRLFNLDGWYAKNDSVEAEDLINVHCRLAIDDCEQGLALLRESVKERTDYFRHWCYFHTHKARAHAMLGDYAAAFQEFDLAVAGLDTEVGGNHVALAMCSLRLADVLMVRADRLLIEDCIDKVRPGASVLSVVGRHFLRFPKVLRESDDYVRRLSSPWIGYSADVAEQNICKASRCSDAIMEIGSVLAPVSRDKVAQLIERALRPAKKNEGVGLALGRSFAYWNAKGLGAATKAAETSWGHALQYLNRAEMALDKAERLLERGGLNFHSWYLLNRLRAQLEFEFMLFELSQRRTGEVRSGASEGSQNENGSPVGGESEIGFARFLERTKRGLGAIRDAFDNVYVGNGVPGRFRAPLKILWCQLFIGCICNAALRLRQKANRASWEEKPSFHVLWKRWIRLNHSVGLSFLVGEENLAAGAGNPYYDYFETIYQAIPDDLCYSLAARGFVELQLKVFPNPLRPLWREDG